MKTWTGRVLVAAVAVAGGMFLHANRATFDVLFWQRQVSPGPLSPAHASLEGKCAACHTPVQSADDIKCIGCHVNNTALLQRQPTSFHANIGECSECHLEHQGVSPKPLPMNHTALAEIGLNVIRHNPGNPSHSRLLAWVRQHETGTETAPTHPEVTSAEAALDCAACHSTKDKHQGYFGGDCASCHRTTAWTIPEFRHPSPRSVECVQCHQPPPSHLMMHFTMVSRSVAKRPDARVDQCFLCHQTTSWNDITGIGWYKHH